ncbi:L-lactate permease [Candidatus Gracilibacteria bacterium]|nr:L-lactate permease [Candidatus Gracilibacteria bacterium]
MNALLAALLALVPLGVVLVLMLVWRWPAANAGLAGLAAALGLAWFVFGFGTSVYPELGVARATGGALAEATVTALTILWIIVPALLLYQLQLGSGAIDVLRSALGSVSDDTRIIAILVAWFFALFLEGAAGFGTSIALTAPFLIGFGFTPVEALSATLIGHSVGVSFGAVGTPVFAQAEMKWVEWGRDSAPAGAVSSRVRLDHGAPDDACGHTLTGGE